MLGKNYMHIYYLLPYTMSIKLSLISTKPFYVDFYRFLNEHNADVSLVQVVDPESSGQDLGELALGVKSGLLVSGNESLSSMSDLKPDVVVTFLPPSIPLTEYARAAITAHAAFLNIGLQSSKEFVEVFKENRLPMAGDYLIAQLDASQVLDRLLNTIKEKGLVPLSAYEIGAGGPELSEELREKKRKDELSLIKDKESVFMGAVEPVDFMGDRRHYYIWLEAEGPLKSKVTLDAWVKFEEGPLLCSPLLSALRAIYDSKIRGEIGPVKTLAPFFKRPV